MRVSALVFVSVRFSVPLLFSYLPSIVIRPALNWPPCERLISPVPW